MHMISSPISTETDESRDDFPKLNQETILRGRMRSKRSNCRLWWPNDLSLSTPLAVSSSCLYFGWFISSGTEHSLDIVVAFATDVAALSSLNLQSFLQQINENMPLSLQDKFKFALLGYSGADLCGNGILPTTLSHLDQHDISINHIRRSPGSELSGDEETAKTSCGCDIVDGLPDQFRQAFKPNNSWFQLVYVSYENLGGKYQMIPRLHHLHWNGHTISELDLHAINYEIPVFGGHHYSLSSRSSYKQVKIPTKKPKWVADLNRKQTHFDLDVVILAINCVNAAKVLLQGHLLGKRSIVPFDISCVATTFFWRLGALFAASFATFLYCILQWGHHLLGYGQRAYVLTTVKYVLHNTWTVIEIRCCQFPYWPIFLQHYVLRAQSCVEYTEKMALRRHSTWSVLVVDVLLGNFFGIALWSHANTVFLCISNLSVEITNNLLRSGCVWLMGNPAGFKLNTELAGVLGMMSLNIIQIWSTIWSVMGFLFIPMSKMVASFGMLFGCTAAAALIVDMILLLTRHLFLLHWVFSLIYSCQLQALAALWRLFRGKKWNPLRLRLDSYDYTVEQHVVGSLLFTPLLLLLPTTSAFYTFFSIINTAISFICIVIEAIIFLIHMTPYNQIILWLVRRRRFPAGIWLQFGSCQSTSFTTSVNGPHELIDSSFPQPSSNTNSVGGSGSTILVSFLHSNYMDLGELVWSNYRGLYSSVPRSSVASSAYGVLTGKRIPSTLGIVLPCRLPWIGIPCKEFWSICYDAVFACRRN